MVYLKIIGDPKEAGKLLKTNRPLKAEQKLRCGDDFNLQKLASKHPHVFQLMDESKEKQETKEAPPPDENKMLSKSKFFKSKNKWR